MSHAEWERIQEIEKAYHEAKDPAKVLDFNLVYWRRILDKFRKADLGIGPDTRVLDAGCGGTGIVLAVEDGIRTGVDPLMTFYLEKFPFLKDHPVEWIEGMAEDFDADQQFDVIFSINMLDHTVDPKASATNLVRLLAPGGRLIVLLNVHRTRLFRRYFSLFYRFIDPPHPHHIHREDLPGFFPGLDLVFREDVDHLWLDLKDSYQQEVRGQSKRDWGKLARTVLNPFKYPLAAARLMANRPVHRRRQSDDPLIAGELLLFTKPDAAK